MVDAYNFLRIYRAIKRAAERGEKKKRRDISNIVLYIYTQSSRYTTLQKKISYSAYYS